MFFTSRKTMKVCMKSKYANVFNMYLHYCQRIAQYSVKTGTNSKSSQIIRREFIDYYTNNLNHVFIPSSSVIPLCDASLAFVNAGMNQFKGIFLGHHPPPSSRVVNYQKCIRVGGKHNDINNVGLDTYHHTFFEMLGNWSFEDYGKREACKYAWDTLTQLYGFDKDQLYVTYFGGDKKLDMQPDTECRDIWKEIGLSNDRIIACGVSDNFWEMSLNGPCGPCTEIHIDRQLHPSDKLPHNGNSNLNLTELWNIVFIEFERLNDACIVPLKKQYIDTGMGFERLVAIIQGKNCNYDTDLFQPLFAAIHSISNAPKYNGKFGFEDERGIDTHYRIIADHARMIAVTLADGMIPESNCKLRRIMRKAINIGTQTFRSDNLLNELTNHVAESLGDVYPEIQKNLKQIQALIIYEAELLKTLKASSGARWQDLVKIKPQLAAISDPYAPGLMHSYEILQSVLSNNHNLRVLPGEVAFKIYDTHGLDLEAIEELARTEHLTVDTLGFNACLENVKIRSRIGVTRSDTNVLSESSMEYLKNNVPKTNDSYKYNCEFDGVKYQLLPMKCKLIGVVKNGNFVNGESINLTSELLDGSEIGILLDRTFFYGLEGGQFCDRGIIHIGNLIFNVTEVNKLNGYIIHYGSFDKSSIQRNTANLVLHFGDETTIEIDEEYRTGLMSNHTATHLLNAALRNIFPVIVQRGSIVKNDSLTFKFSTFGKEIQPEHMILIQKQINDCIQSKVPINTKVVNMFQFMNEKNLIIIPDEVYPENNLRIIEVSGAGLNSKEACCGTHVHNTGVLQHFSIVDVISKGSSETIVAVTGKYAIDRTSKNTANEMKNDIISKLHFKDAKDVNMRKKNILNLLTSEFNKVINSTHDPYIIHCFESHNAEVESIPLQIIIELCTEMPVFLIAISSRKFRARCHVPSGCLSDSFNAYLWMKAIESIVPIKLGSFKDEDPLTDCHTKVLKLPRNEIISSTENVIKEAKRFISINIKQSINKNN